MASYKEFREQTYRRRRKRNLRNLGLVLLVGVVIVGLAWVITTIIERPQAGMVDAAASTASVAAESVSSDAVESAASTPAESTASTPAESTAVSTASGATSLNSAALAPLPMQATVEAGDLSWNTVGPNEQTINFEITNPSYLMLALPATGVVDTSYFNTATFVGDSLTQGLELYSTGLPNAHYCAYRGIGPNAIVNGTEQTREDGTKEIPMEALVASQPDYVYILLGTNSLVATGTDDAFLEYYSQMIDMIKSQLNPAVRIYMQAIPPVKADVVETKPGLDNNRLREINNRLAKLALEKGCYFLNLQEVFADDEGNLRADCTYEEGDGIHMNPDGYQAWVDYLCTHTAYDKRNPYLYGSPYYIEGA